jgi:hypothetical protein
MSTCVAQTYWYRSGHQTAVYCDKPATRVTEALDGSRSHCCDGHAGLAIVMGAVDVTSSAAVDRGRPSPQMTDERNEQ